MTAPPDAAARMEALDPRRSFIVQAPAGSGKTELLIRRYLTLLERVEHPEAVLALTFTRKAAFEMRHRVLAALQAASGPEPEDPRERETWRLAARVLARDRELGWRLSAHPARLAIQTIDSLSASLVGRMPWTSRMGARVEPDEHVGHLYRRAAVATLVPGQGEGGPGADLVLGHLDNDVERAARLLAGMLRRRDQWLRHVAGDSPTPSMRSRLEEALAGIVARDLRELESALPPALLASLIRLARFAGGQRAREAEPGPVAACRDLDTPPFGPEPWMGIAEMLLTRQGARRRMLDRRQGFPPTSEGRKHRDEALGLDLDPAWLRRLHAVRDLPPPAYEEGQWRVLASLVGLLPVAAARLKLEFAAEGVLDFTEIAQAACAALGTPETPTGLAFAMDCRLQHLLVDEFQDTSRSQFDLLRMLTADWQEGDGRTLFLVGDPMQSIYGFRDADVGLFLRARSEGLGSVSLTPLTLTANFRSRWDLVDWINEAVGPAFPADEDVLRGAVTHEKSQAFAGSPAVEDPDAGVHVHPVSVGGEAQEAHRVVEIVRKARRRSPEGSIAVLVSARSHLDIVLRALTEAGLPSEAVEIGSLGRRPAVRDLLALTRALLDPADRIAWLAILRAPWCGLTLSDLEALVGGEPDTAVWDLVTMRERVLSADGAARLRRFTGVIAKALEARADLGLSRWVEATWMELGGPATVLEARDLDDARLFFDLLGRSAPGDNIRNEERFLESLEAMVGRPPDPAADSPVQLLTIHKAKGLEFDTVILPGMGRTGRQDEPSLMSWLEHVGPTGAPELLLAPIPETGEDEDALSRYIRGVERARRDHEATRLLYVAATRARRSLHILGSARQRPDGRLAPAARSLLWKIWPAVEAEFGVRPGGGETGGADAPLPRAVCAPLRRLSLDWRPPEPPASLPESGPVGDRDTWADGPPAPSFDWAGDVQRRVGIVVHAILQGLADPEGSAMWLSPSGEVRIRVALAAEGVGPGDVEAAAGRVQLAIRNTVEDARGRWILRRREEDARELPISSLTDRGIRRFVLDRTFVEEGVRWIVDYKTGAHEGGGREAFLDNEVIRYRGQLAEYAEAMRCLDDRPIRVGLYFPLLQGWRECSL